MSRNPICYKCRLTDLEGGSRSHLPYGRRESNLGSTAHPRRTAHALFRYLGTNGLPLDETSTERSAAGQTLAGLSAQPPRSPCSMDFFTVPTITFGALYCFFLIGHDRRRILHFNVTKHPTSLWIVQQLREAFPFELVSRFLIFEFGPWGLGRCGLRSKALGKTVSRSAGWKAADETYWITSWR